MKCCGRKYRTAHKEWMTVEVDSKEAARNMLLSAYRSRVNIVGLDRFIFEQADEMLGSHTL